MGGTAWPCSVQPYPAAELAHSSTSTRAPSGRAATPIAVRAGRWSPKNVDPDLVARGEVAHVDEEQRRLDHLGRRARPRRRGPPRRCGAPGRAGSVVVGPTSAILPSGPSAAPSWPDVTTRSPALANGLYGPNGAGMAPPQRRVGHVGPAPSANHTAASVAANTAVPTATAAGRRGDGTSTSTCGSALAGVMPKDRIVRSTGVPGRVDGDALGRHHREALVHRADGEAAGRRHGTAGRRRRARRATAPSRSAHRRARTVGRAAPSSARRRRRASTARAASTSATTAPRCVVPTGGPTTSTTSTTSPRASDADRVATARRARHEPLGPAEPDHARAVAAQPERERRALLTAQHDGLARPACAHRRAVRRGEPRGVRGDDRAPRFAPKSPALPAGEAGTPPGAHQLASGSRYAGSTQVVCSTRSNSPRRQRDGVARARRWSCGPGAPPRPAAPRASVAATS